MGYAKPNQDAGGIHLRQFCRAAIIVDGAGTRLVYISLDNGMVSQLLRTQLMKRLHYEFGGAFNESNVMISATHTHSGPGGYFQYLLYNIPSAGYIAQTLEALVGGISRCVRRASESMQLARIHLHKGELVDASINRSPTSYTNNPIEERAKYKYDTDKVMYLLRFDTLRGEPLGMINWFAVHGTSMNNSNHLISSDNKGYAALLFEQAMNQKEGASLPGRGKFVALFAQANEGDVSPNTRGPRCIDTGLPCDLATSTCGNPPRNEKCIAFGPGKDMFESTKIIAYKQYNKARQLFFDTTNQRPVRGPLRFVHEYIDITKQQVPVYQSMIELSKRTAASSNTNKKRRRADTDQTATTATTTIGKNNSNETTVETCVAALGYSFAAGTTDGPGAFDFQQGDTVSSRYWNMVRNFLRKPSEALVKCQHPKPILLSTGEMDFPYMWHPRVVPTQIFMIGDQLALVGLPGEFTTMSGRRVRQAVRDALTMGSSPSPASSSNRNQQAGKDDLATDEACQMGQQARRGGSAALMQHADCNIGRRLRHEVGENNTDSGHVEVILSGLSNIYTSYVTTIEEYDMQRYEGASTLYGPHTLQAYANQFARLARVLATTPHSQSFELSSSAHTNSVQPPDLTKSLFTLKAGVIFDGTPHGKKFGDLLEDVERDRIYVCRDLVSVSFVAGNPRNDLKQEESFLYVEKFNPVDQSWLALFSDASWETKFIWERTNTLFGESKATIEWEIPDYCATGIYRIRHLGAHKTLLQTIGHYEGKSSNFRVLATPPSATSNSSRLFEQHRQQLIELESQFKLLEQLGESTQQAQQPVNSGQVPANPKSDRGAPSSSPIINSMYNFLSSIFGRRL